MLAATSKRVLASPEWKTFFATAIPIAIGVLSGSFVFEITTPSGLDWKAFYLTKSFYGLLVLMVLAYLYNRAVYLYEANVERFQDDGYCRAYMRSKCLPEAAERYRQLIRNGEGGELIAAMEEFERILR